MNKNQPASVAEPVDTSVTSFSSLFPGKWSFNGAIRARVDANWTGVDAIGAKTPSSYFGFDTLILKPSYDSDTLFFAAQYRIYGGAYPFSRSVGYKQDFGEVSFPVFAYVGWKFTPFDNVTVGINQVPFGLQPLFTSTFYSSMAFYTGAEEVYNFGVKYSHVDPDINYQLGYYPGAAPNGFGLSLDSTRYSNNIVRADSYVPFGTNNREENMFVGRIEKTVYKTPVASLALGGSLWHSSIYNFDTNLTGSKQFESIHAIATYGNFTARLIYVRQDIWPRNPIRNDIITIGGFDFSNNMATHGNVFSGDLSYKFALNSGPFTDITPYFNYSAFVKDKSSFKTSDRFILGSAFSVRDLPGLIIYSEARIGRNDPYTGSFLNGLAAGGDDKYKTIFYTNIGYYW